MTSLRTRVTAKLYQEDLVQLADTPHTFGLVVRCWHDAEDMPPIPEEALAADPLMRPLKQGEVGVSFYPKGAREILPEAKLDLVDRVYQPGDLLKKSIDDLRAGIVTSIDVKGRLEHSITGEDVPGWMSTSEVETAIDVELGDYVVHNDWVGQVCIYMIQYYLVNIPQDCRGTDHLFETTFAVLTLPASYLTKPLWRWVAGILFVYRSSVRDWLSATKALYVVTGVLYLRNMPLNCTANLEYPPPSNVWRTGSVWFSARKRSAK